MAQFNIDSLTVRAIKNDDIKSTLMQMIDAELSKSDDTVDTSFVDECVNALLDIECENDKSFAVTVPIIPARVYLNTVQPQKIIKWKSINVFARAAIIAAITASTTFTGNCAYQMLTGDNLMEEVGSALHEKLVSWGLLEAEENDLIPIELPENKEESTTAPAQPEEKKNKVVRLAEPVSKGHIEQLDGGEEDDEETTTRHYIEQLDGGEEDDDETTTHRTPEPTTAVPAYVPTKREEVVLTSLEAEYDDSFKSDYIYGEELSYDGLILTANYSDGSRKAVDIDDCEYTKSVNMNVTADYTLRIIYQKCIVTIDITVRPDEETRGSVISCNEDFDYLITSKGVYLTAFHSDKKILNLDRIDGNTVYAVGASVFEGADIESVNLPNVKKIFDNAFKSCRQLSVCSAPQVKYIGNSAFEDCEILQNADAENATDYLGERAWAGSGITSITLPENSGAVPDSLCDSCAKLETADLNGAIIVGKSAFSDCVSLSEVRGTANLKAVGETAFYGDEAVTFETPPGELECVAVSGFAYCKSLKFGALNKLAAIGDYAFMYCSGLTGIAIDDDIKVIPQGAFWGTRIKSVTLPDSLRRIEAAAFMSTMLSSVTVPDSVEYIGARAFQTAGGLTVSFNGSPEIENGAFVKSSRLKFYAYEGSTAVDYAVENEINYEIIERS